MRSWIGLGGGPVPMRPDQYGDPAMRRTVLARNQSTNSTRTPAITDRDWAAAANIGGRNKQLDLRTKRRKDAAIGLGGEVEAPVLRKQATVPVRMGLRPMAANIIDNPSVRRSSSESTVGGMELLREREQVARQSFEVYGSLRREGVVARDEVPAIFQDLGLCDSESPALGRFLHDQLGDDEKRPVSFHEFVKLQNVYRVDYVPVPKAKARKTLENALKFGHAADEEEDEKEIFRIALEAALEEGEENAFGDDVRDALCAALLGPEDGQADEDDEGYGPPPPLPPRRALNAGSDDEDEEEEETKDAVRFALERSLIADDSDEEEEFRMKARASLEQGLLGGDH